ncbi:LuxR family transcriptional regulator [Jannaschia sp. W003]|uniref:helix-turn-helix transcriptional regulator n=1 Tax=Jannaschia sp. W003 TaxID=2867012 RepID=UPI0021A748FE|nr:LuxR family transcriptional regulator [Jannaschia sp. W003]UWQ20718.1 LuxR family transcriptional regulator [Jannaschia sp. W003]
MNACARVEAADTIEAVWDLAIQAFAAEGIDVVILLSSDPSHRDVRVLTNVPAIYEGWDAARDPFLDHCCRSYAIMPTGAEFGCEYDYLGEDDRAFIDRAATLGFRSGLAIPVRMQGAGRFGGFNLGTPLPRAEFERRILPFRETFRLFCLVVHRRLTELGFERAPARMPCVSDDPASFTPPALRPAELHPEASAPLSPREKEVLLLQMQGLKRKEVARICAISPHTVAEYTAKAYRKLGVSNRMEAAQLLWSER